MHGYTVVAQGPGGTSQQQQNVNVVGEATATPVPTVAPDLPVVTAFSVNPNQIAAGECVNITWSTGGGTSWVNVVRDDDVIWDNAPLQGQVQDCPPDTGTVNYAVIAYNPQDDTDRRDEQVQVSDAPPENPLAGTRWFVTQLNGESALPDSSLTAKFGQGGDLNGHGGCNSYSAGYTVNGEGLSIGGISSSQKICDDPPGVMEQEQAFFGALSSASSFFMEAGQLYIQNAGGVIEFVDSGP
jgi:heat shock protein HslJ